ncbi:MAG TPA: hypothetical protein VHO84_01795 [Syntrophorhabdaceae bacterium]|nr:hypothetical protein [Syntrophorhabdaceae bacterium]
MKNAPLVFLLICTLFFQYGCALFPSRESTPIEWPSDISHVQAIAQVNIAWNNMRYSGDMSLKLDYPDSLFVEVYGPFGDTVLSIQKTPESFLLRSGSDVYRDEAQFARQFHMTVDDFMDDLAMKGSVQSDTNGNLFTQRNGYRVVYSLLNNQNRMCWLSSEGTMCIHFLEAVFQ